MLCRCPAERPDGEQPLLLLLPCGLERLPSFATARWSGLMPLLLLPGGAASHQLTEPPVAALAQSPLLSLLLPGRAALCFAP